MYMMRFYQIIVHHIAMLHIALVYACGHVYRHAAQSERPALHSPVRILSCGKESHETDLGQPHGLAAGTGGRVSRAAARGNRSGESAGEF